MKQFNKDKRKLIILVTAIGPRNRGIGQYENALLPLLASKLAKHGHSNVFFYLDAHPFNFRDDLQLCEEVAFIFNSWKNSVVMIDEFKVPGTEYFFYDYGLGKKFDLEYNAYIRDAFFLFPVCGNRRRDQREERCCVVLCRESRVRDVLLNVPSIAICREQGSIN